MQIHQVRPNTPLKQPKRIGRGGKRGTTSGRGTKGQRSRAGAKIRPAIRDVIKRLPKKRGYRFRSFRPHPVVLRLTTLDQYFSPGAKITPRALRECGLIRTIKGKLPPVKILDSGTITKTLHLAELAVSRPAARRVIEAGGTVGR